MNEKLKKMKQLTSKPTKKSFVETQTKAGVNKTEWSYVDTVI